MIAAPGTHGKLAGNWRSLETNNLIFGLFLHELLQRLHLQYPAPYPFEQFRQVHRFEATGESGRSQAGLARLCGVTRFRYRQTFEFTVSQ
jgi:hypothetical protein